MTRYAHDDKTFRLVRMRTERYVPANPLTYRPDGGLLQDFAYEYDLAGNIVRIIDRVPGSGFIKNPESVRMQQSDPQLAQLLATGDALIRHFEYDPLYRLMRATGRGSNNIPGPRPRTDDARQGFNASNHGTPTQANAPRLTTGYWEAYEYDPAGNLVALKHGRNGTPDWIRHFGMAKLTPQQWEQAWKAHLNAGGGPTRLGINSPTSATATRQLPRTISSIRTVT
jgi:hypothetical protein